MSRKVCKRKKWGSHPLVKKAEKNAIEENFRSQLLTVQCQIFEFDDGDDATELLSILAVVIGAPCQAGASCGMYEQPWVKQLHGALRTIQSMCLENGYRWQSIYAPALNRACEVAIVDRPQVTNNAFISAYVDACSMSASIATHTLQRDEVSA